MIQPNTFEWLEYRKNKIGASDAPVIMQVSPWKTPYQLWLEKLGAYTPEYNPAMIRGQKLEKEALQKYQDMTGFEMQPFIFEHPERDWQIASLDGITQNQDAIVEIKCAGKIDHSIALDQKIPEKYYPQLQHQLAVTGLDSMHYFSYDGEEGVIVDVKRDQAYIDQLLEKEIDFYAHVTEGIPPQFCDKDVFSMQGDVWFTLTERYKNIKSEMMRYEAEEKKLREQLIEMAENKSVVSNGVKITKNIKKGRINYEEIAELQHIDLEQYRKAPSTCWTITISSKP